MPLGIGSAIGAIGGIAGGLYGSKKKSDYASRVKAANERARKSALRFYKNQSGQALADMSEAYRMALQDIQGVGQTAKLDILGRGKAQQGSNTQHLMNTGLYNTTAAAQSSNQIASMTNRDLGSLAEQIARLRSTTRLAGGGALANLRAGMMPQGVALRGWSPYAGLDSPDFNSFGVAGAELGSLLGQIPWGSLFGGGSQPQSPGAGSSTGFPGMI